MGAETDTTLNSVRNPLLQSGTVNQNPARSVKESRTEDASSLSFRSQLLTMQQAKSGPEAGDISFSKHAVRRMDERGIEMNDTLKGNLIEAVDRAREKGAKEVAVIGRDGVFIVNVPHNVVVTTMGQDDMDNGIVTNIDSAVIL